jgi:hypothetical protein
MLAARTENLGPDSDCDSVSNLYGKFLALSVGWLDVGGSMIQMLGVKSSRSGAGNPSTRPISANVRPNIWRPNG